MTFKYSKEFKGKWRQLARHVALCHARQGAGQAHEKPTPGILPKSKNKMNTSVHFSSATDLWATPQEFFDRLNHEFTFSLDVCALADNAKCSKYFTKEIDGLRQEWTGTCWMNPPYGREIGLWMKKAHESSLGGATVVCLTPARTDTAWWHDYASKGEIRFVRGRLKFGGHNNSAPFPSAVVVFRPPVSEELAA